MWRISRAFAPSPKNRSNVRSAKPRGLLIIMVCFVGICWGNTSWIYAKARVAQWLIADAWEQTLTTGGNVKPWSWADTWPVARISFPDNHLSLYALAGSSGTSLAFGPGHMDGTALPHEAGTKVFNGHRDTHFQVLENIASGDAFHVQGKDGMWQNYVVEHTLVVDSRESSWMINPTVNAVHLITCYPVNGIAPDPYLRLVVIAKPVFSRQSHVFKGVSF